MSLPASTLVTPLARRFDLWWQFTVRAVELRHRGSYLGFVWIVLNPLLMLGLYVTVFGFIFGGRFDQLPNETPWDYAIGVFLGLILFHLLAEAIATAPSFIVGNPNFVKKVVFPLEILPLANIGAYCFHFAISVVLLLVGGLIIGQPFTLAGFLWLPVIILPHILLCIGLGWLLSALGVFFRDIVQITTFVSLLILYASAVFYSPEMVLAKAPELWTILKWNPVLHTIDLARKALLWHQPIELSTLGYTWLCGLAMCVIGWTVFRTSRPAFGDVL
jgi:lipopolysaccharide transport system permease protein